MSFVSRLIDPNPPLTSAQVRQAVAAALQAADLNAQGIQDAASAAITATDPPSQIKRIQRGTMTLSSSDGSSGTVTILAVNMAKTALVMLGSKGFAYVSQRIQGGGSQGYATQYAYRVSARIRLASATTIEWNKDSDRSGEISYEVIEYV